MAAIQSLSGGKHPTSLASPKPPYGFVRQTKMGRALRGFPEELLFDQEHIGRLMSE